MFQESVPTHGDGGAAGVRATGTDVPDDLLEAQRRVVRLLGERRPTPRAVPQRHAVGHPEVRKTLENTSDRLRRLCDPAMRSDARDCRLRALLRRTEWLTGDEDPRPRTPEQAWGLADALRALWLDLAPEDALLAYASEHPVPRPATSASAAERAAHLRVWLLHDHDARRKRGSHERARAALRTHYLQRVGAILWALVLTSTVVGIVVADDVGGLLLTALAGATGGALSGTRALRDAVNLTRARGFQAWWWIQPAVGAAVGLLVYAVLQSPILSLPGSDAASSTARTSSFVVYAFAAGFSEPFILGILAKITGAADAAANDAANPPRPSGLTGEPVAVPSPDVGGRRSTG